MTAEESLRAGNLAETLALVQSDVRQRPADAQLRAFLAQLLLVLGQWERALTQLKVLGEMDPTAVPFVYACRGAIEAEAVRSAVFSGAQTPIVFGEPRPWLAPLIQAMSEAAAGRYESARRLRGEAFDAAEASQGRIGEQSFSWIADADSRLGAVLEVILEGRYYWLPFERIGKIVSAAPESLHALVWNPVRLTLSNGGEVGALIPSRYPGTVVASDDALKLCRKTEWVETHPDQVSGLGQRLLATDAGDYPLLDIREIVFETATAA